MLLHFDTDFLVTILRGRYPEIIPWWDGLEGHQHGVSEMVRAELLVGCRKSSSPKLAVPEAIELLSRFGAFPYGGDAVEHYADIRCHLEREGTPIGPNDLIVAATARAAGATLITGNVREFSRVPDLALRDWRSEI